MPYYIHKRTANSKAFTIEICGSTTTVTSKRDTAFSATFILPSFSIQKMNGIGCSEAAKFLIKAEEFARKNIIIK